MVRSFGWFGASDGSELRMVRSLGWFGSSVEKFKVGLQSRKALAIHNQTASFLNDQTFKQKLEVSCSTSAVDSSSGFSNRYFSGCLVHTACSYFYFLKLFLEKTTVYGQTYVIECCTQLW